jgi:hypothetical protein
MRDSHSHFRVCWELSIPQAGNPSPPHTHTRHHPPRTAPGPLDIRRAVVLGVTTLALGAVTLALGAVTLALGAVTLALAVGRLDLPLEDGTILCSRGEDTLRMT